MKPEKPEKSQKTYLNDLKPTIKEYKVKVTVAEKSRVIVSPQKGTRYIQLVLEDDQGTKMRGALFGNQIEEYGDTFQEEMSYEIANAPLEPVNARYAKRADDCQMTFGGQAVIQPLTTEKKPKILKYIPLASISHTSNSSDRFDVLALILYIGERRIVTTSQGVEHPVREIIVTDHSTEQTMTISAWDDLAEINDAKMLAWAEQPTVVAFLSLKPATYKGFSLATSISTTFNTNPVGDEVKAFHDWIETNKPKLFDKMARILDIKNPTEEKKILPIEDLMLKKPHNTLQEERHWLQVTIPEPDQTKIIAYSGCNKCGKRTHEPLNKTFNCTACFKQDCTSVPRITFKFDVSDGTGSLSFTAFSEDCEKLFQLTAAEIYEKLNNDTLDFGTIAHDLSTNAFLLKVGPTSALSRNNVLSWVLKGISRT